MLHAVKKAINDAASLRDRRRRRRAEAASAGNDLLRVGTTAPISHGAASRRAEGTTAWMRGGGGGL